MWYGPDHLRMWFEELDHDCTYHSPLTPDHPGHTVVNGVQFSLCVWCVCVHNVRPSVVFCCFHRYVTSDLVTSQKRLVSINLNQNTGFSSRTSDTSATRTSALILIRCLSQTQLCSVWTFYRCESLIHVFLMFTVWSEHMTGFHSAWSPDGMRGILMKSSSTPTHTSSLWRKTQTRQIPPQFILEKKITPACL